MEDEVKEMAGRIAKAVGDTDLTVTFVIESDNSYASAIRGLVRDDRMVTAVCYVAAMLMSEPGTREELVNAIQPILERENERAESGNNAEMMA